MSLMDKYFSTANSLAAAAKQIKKNADLKKSTKLTKKSGVGKKVSNLNKKRKGLMKKDIDKQEKVNELKKEEGNVGKDGDRTDGKFVCGYCPLRYNNKQELLAHVEDHMNEMEEKESPGKVKKPVSFDTSGSKLHKDSKDLKAKPGPEIQKFKCGECGQVFTSKPSFLEHVRIHAAEKPFECDICHKFFKERTFLSEHRKTHVQEKLLRCSVCNKAFVHQIDLDSHMKSHPKRSGNVVKKVKKKDPDPVAAPAPPAKPKSFASALSGELEPAEKGSSSSTTLVLKRIDQSARSTDDGKSKGSKPVSTEGVSSAKKVTVTTDTSAKEEKTDVGHCTCKECPECVTRFLQSFDT